MGNSYLCVAVEVPEKEPEITKNGDATTGLPVRTEDSIKEEEEENEPKEKQFKPPTPTDTSPVKPYAWRIDLAQTETHWTGWFTNLSSKFLSVPATKMLILAGIDRLDRDLTVDKCRANVKCKFYRKPGM